MIVINLVVIKQERLNCAIFSKKWVNIIKNCTLSHLTTSLIIYKEFLFFRISFFKLFFIREFISTIVVLSMKLTSVENILLTIRIKSLAYMMLGSKWSLFYFLQWIWIISKTVKKWPAIIYHIIITFPCDIFIRAVNTSPISQAYTQGTGLTLAILY